MISYFGKIQLELHKLTGMTILAFFVSLALCFTVIFYAIFNRLNMERVQMRQIMSEKIQRIDSVMSRLFYKTEVLAALVRLGDGSIHYFDILAPSIVDDPAILNILIAPDGIVSHVYSQNGDTSSLLIGHNFFEDSSGNIEALMAIEKGELIMAGPFIARQGYTVLAGRLPVFLDSEKQDFWGLVSVTLRFPEALDNAELSGLLMKGYEYELWRLDPDTNEKQVLASNLTHVRKKAHYIEKSAQIQNATWHLRLLSTNVWYLHPENIVMIFAGFLISILSAFLVQKNVGLKKVKIVLEATHAEVMSSIQYANKIQKNLLPTDSVLKTAFSDYSVIWEPRDVVGGDIYWAKNFEDGTVLCICDCTGHGTPGALLTMLVVSAFESTITEKDYKDTAQILYMLDKRLATVLNVKTDDSVSMDINDGCDLAVLFIAKDGGVTVSSGNTNVFVCDGEKVTRHKGQSIFIGEGRISHKDEIKTIIIPSNPSNKYYIASDGLSDQIGGEKNRKFGYKTFEGIILDNHNEGLNIITKRIWDIFEEYRGNQPRRDDFELITFKPRI